jgi:hypothetical protein
MTTSCNSTSGNPDTSARPTPEFDEPISLQEAQKKRIIGSGAWYNHGGPWVHLNEYGELVNETGPR